jgi:TonB family protein
MEPNGLLAGVYCACFWCLRRHYQAVARRQAEPLPHGAGAGRAAGAAGRRYTRALSCQFLDFHPQIGVSMKRVGSLKTLAAAGAILASTVMWAQQPALTGNTQANTSTATGEVFQVGGEVSPPSVIHAVDREYSDGARRARYSGVSVVGLIVDAQGNPQQVRVIHAVGMGLDEKAVEAVQQYKFKPAMYQGRAVPVEVKIGVNFRIYDRANMIKMVADPTADDRANLIKLVHDPEEQKLVLDGAKRSSVMVNNPCPAAEYEIDLRHVLIWQPVSFDESGKIQKGVWKQPVNESGCGANRILNVYVQVYLEQGAPKLRARTTVPGMTHADPLLQSDIRGPFMAAVGGAHGYDKSCKNAYIADTEYFGRKGDTLPGGKEPPWQELWTLISCAQKIEVPVLFTPDATGTGILVRSADIKVFPLEKKVQ